ncbi:hypothetical protein [Anderseniella sp. Alg231-50]|uniref:hypothetical protein n=1 Tax=Anderseniella sp. Alg231-50 TaxID=1922226 RepID=UPI000D55D1E9
MTSQGRLQKIDNRPPFFLWIVSGAALLCCAFVLASGSAHFAYELEVADRPIFLFVTGYMFAGSVFLAMALFLIPRSLAVQNPLPLLMLMMVFGLAMRVVLFGSVPVQENDYYRYLWDGALTAHGINPWKYSPQTILSGSAADPTIVMLKAQAGPVLERINYGELRSIYPSVSQAAFAVAYMIKPFSLEAWRGVLLLLDLVTFGLILWLLSALNRPLIWSCLYWWNPVVIKEVMNSAHMEPVLLVPLLAALVLCIKARPVAASGVAALAVAAKVWPVLILPAIWRPLLRQPARLAAAMGSAGLLVLALYWPVVATQLDQSSGFVAFSTGWERISAAFLVLTAAANLIPSALVEPGTLARLLTAAVIAAIVLFSNRKPATEPADTVHRFLIAAAAMLLLSPVQLPWYFIWIAPFLCVFPYRGLLLITVTFPLYYAFFKLTALKVDESWLLALVWVMWLPVWALLFYDWWTGKELKPDARCMEKAT